MLTIDLPDHTTLACECHGNGAPLLFIHGYPLSRRLWERQWLALSDFAQVIAPDLRGHGDSQPGQAPHTMEQFAQDCFDLLDVLGIASPVHICGLSMGGYVAMAMLRLQPERIASLILTATRAAADTPEAKASRDASIKLVQEQGVEPIIAGMLPRLLSPHSLADRPDLVSLARQIMSAVPASTVIKDLQGLKERRDSTRLLAGSSAPVLIIHGADDQIVPLAEAQTLQQTIPNAQLTVLPKAGHLPNLEQPALFNQAICRFLESLSHEQK